MSAEIRILANKDVRVDVVLLDRLDAKTDDLRWMAQALLLVAEAIDKAGGLTLDRDRLRRTLDDVEALANDASEEEDR